MPAIERGDFLPMFSTPSSIGPRFDYGSVAGRRHLLVFLGSAGTELGARLRDVLIDLKPTLQRHGFWSFVVCADPADKEKDRLRALLERYVVFWDFDREIYRRFGLLGPEPTGGGPRPIALAAIVVRENLRFEKIESAAPIETFAARIEQACAAVPPLPAATTMGSQAPVLVVPEVFDRDFCRHLIDHYEAQGGEPSGFMRDDGNVTREYNDARIKRRQDCWIDDPDLLSRLRRYIHGRVSPEIKKAFQFEASRIERFVIGCYDAREQGFFSAHRDNTSIGTAHRKFAVTINLNSEEYDGGELWFPEFGPLHYKAPSGSAIVFSCSLLHEARPVTAGRRYAFLPFLYDEAGAEVRRRNEAHVAADEPSQETVRSLPVE